MNLLRMLIWSVLMVWALELYSHAQLPDAPSASKSVCYTGAMDNSGQFMYVEVDCRSVPVFSKPAPYVPIVRKPGFFTMLPNRTNKQTLTSPWFIVPSVLAVGASAANVTRSRRAGAAWGDASAMLPLVGLGYVMDRFVCRAFSVAGLGYVVGLRTYGAATGTYR
jgi:hypothetical protein